MSDRNSRSVRIIGIGIILIISILAITLTVELILRNNWRYARASYAHDSDLIWRLRSNLKGERPYANWYVEGKQPFILSLNKDGFRGENWKKEKDVGTRIMILGDSYTAGLDYPEEEIFTSIIEKDLNSNTDKEYCVMNVSCPAWGTDQQLVYWQKEGVSYEIDYLVLMISPNDIRESYKKELIELDKGNQLKYNKSRIPEEERKKWGLANRYSIYQYLQKKFFETSYGEFDRISNYYQFNYGINDDEDWDFPIFLKNPPQEVKQSFELFESLLRQLKKLTIENKVQLILCTIPIRTEIEGLKNHEKYQPGKVAVMVDSIAIREGIPHVNLFEKLVEKDNPSYIYQHWEHHLNTDGHKFVANEVVKYFLNL